MTINHPSKFSPEDYQRTMREQDLQNLAEKFGVTEHLEEIVAYRGLVEHSWHDISAVEKMRKGMNDNAVAVADIAERIEHMTVAINSERQYQEAVNLGYLGLSGAERARYKSMLGETEEVAHFLGWFRSVAGELFIRTEDVSEPQKLGIDMGGNAQMGNWQLGRDTHALAKSIPGKVRERFGSSCEVELVAPEPSYQYTVSGFRPDVAIEKHPVTNAAGKLRRRLPLANMHFAAGEVELLRGDEDEHGQLHVEPYVLWIPEQTVRLYMQSHAVIFPELIDSMRHKIFLQNVEPWTAASKKHHHDGKAAEIAGGYFHSAIVQHRGDANEVLPLDSRIIDMALRPV